MVRNVINEIMCNFYIRWKEIADIYNVSPEELKNTVAYNAENLTMFETDNLIKFGADDLMVTDLGKYFIRNIAASFDPNLKTNTKKFSKAL